MSDDEELSQLRICVEKHLPHEEHEHETMWKKSNSAKHFQKLKAAFYTGKIWPKGSTIKVEFLPKDSKTSLAAWTMIEVMKERRLANGKPSPIDPIEYEIRKLSHEDAVKRVIEQRISPITDLNFEFVEKGKGNIRVGFVANKGSWSLLGTDCLKTKAGEKTLNLGWMDASTIMHEFGHVLGMIHEHDNPVQNQIQWDKEALYKWAKETQGWDKKKVDTNIIKKYKVSQLNASKYDPNSIMLYFFPAKLTLNKKSTNINQRLSREDVKYISKIYPGGNQTPSEFYQNAYKESISGKQVRYIKYVGWVVLSIFLVIILIKIKNLVYNKSGKRYRR